MCITILYKYITMKNDTVSTSSDGWFHFTGTRNQFRSPGGGGSRSQGSDIVYVI